MSDRTTSRRPRTHAPTPNAALPDDGIDPPVTVQPDRKLQPFTFNDQLSLDEVQKLTAAGLDPDRYCSITVPTLGMQAVGQGKLDGPSGPVETILLQLTISVPVRVRSVLSTMLDANGQQMQNPAAKVFPAAPAVTLCVEHAALSVPAPAARAAPGQVGGLLHALLQRASDE